MTIHAEHAEPSVEPAPGQSYAETSERQPTVQRFFGSASTQASLTAVAFFVIFAIYGVWLGIKFLNVDARLLDVHQNVPILLLGLAVLITLIAGQFDLSVASMATLTAFLSIGLSVKQELPFALVIVCCLAVGSLGGLLNGLLVVRLRVNTFIATLGTGGLFAGAAAVYSGGTQLTSTPRLPSWFAGLDSLGAFATKFPAPVLWLLLLCAGAALVRWLLARRPARFTSSRWAVASAGCFLVLVGLLFTAFDLADWVAKVSWSIGVLLFIALALWVLLRQTTYGRNIEAVGANPEAARLAGVRVGRETIIAFLVGGTLAALAGMLLAAGQGSAPVDAAAGFLLPAFAAAFLSTVVFSNGQFTVWGTLIGGTFLVWVSQGLIIGGLPFTWTSVVNGAVLIAAVAVSTVLRRA